VNRTLAGIHDPRDTMSPGARRIAAARALGTEAEVVELGALTVAYTGPRLPTAARCVLDGHVYNLDGVAREACVASDAPPEVVLAALQARLGDGFVERLRGDFSLVVWSETGERVLLVRDHLGGRSLVLHREGSRTAFASETRELLRLLPARPAPDAISMAHWLGISGPPGDRTLYQGIRRLEPGHLARLDGAPLEPRRYWFPERVDPVRLGADEAAAELRAAIIRAVGRRCRPGERSGVMLSGGLDSGAVAATAARTLGADRAPVAGYSAVFPRHPDLDESRYIDPLTDELGLQSVRIAVEDGSVIAGSLDYLEAWGLPPVSPNLFFWNPLLRRAAADGVTTLLDGEGGDAIFYYSPYMLADRLRRGHVLAAIRLARSFPGGPPPARRVLSRLNWFGLRPALPVPAWLTRARARRRDPAEQAPAWFTPELARAFVETDESRLWERERGPRWSTWLLSTLYRGGGTSVVYDHVRRRAAMAGLEARHPLYDVDVIELVLRLPPELALDRALSRPLFRRSMAGLLPEHVRRRTDKSSFDVVFHQILAGNDLAVVRRVLSGSPEVGAYVDPATLRRELLEGAPSGSPLGLQMWALWAWRTATAECWLRQQENSDFARDLRETLVPSGTRNRILVRDSEGPTFFHLDPATTGT
jgi:asparagine synthase (glutamine-hydrolysing)